jgi:outer membrane protein, heavy metal efflux system
MNANGIRFRVGAATIGLGLAAGCAAEKGDPPFESVRSVIVQRTGQRVQWNRNSRDDDAVEAAVAGLLAKDMTEGSAVQIALLNNRDLQATYEDLGVAQADLVQAGLLKNPVFSAAFEAADAGGGIKLQMSVLEDFVSILQIPLRKRIAGAALEASELTAEKAVVELAGRVREAFIGYEAAAALLDLRGTEKQAAEAALDLAQRMHDAGNAGDMELYQRQVRREEAEVNLLAAQAAVNDGREQINLLLGLDGEQVKWTAAAKLADLPEQEAETDGIEQRATQSNFDLSGERWQIEQAAARAGVAKSFAWLDDAQIGPSVEKESEHGPWETGGAVSVPLPIFDFGQAEKARTMAGLRREVQRYLALSARVRSAARRAAARLVSARLRAASTGQVIAPLRGKIVEQMQLQYNGMLAGTFELLEAKESQIDAEAQAIEALRDYWLARARLECIAAGGDGDS